MKYNYYSKDEIKIRVGIMVFISLISAAYPFITRGIFEEPIQCSAIKAFLILIIGLGVAGLILLCDTKAANKLEKIEVKSVKDYSAERTRINIKRNIFFIFILINYLFLWMNIYSFGIENTEEWKYGLTMYVIVTPLAMLATAGATYLYFKIRSNKKEK